MNSPIIVKGWPFVGIAVPAEPGPAGPQGEAGPQGLQGDTGSQGPVGATGPKGDVGLQGPKGDKGDPGIAGPQGSAGSIGPAGQKGDTGATGLQGVKGDTGASGAQGIPGAVGPAGPKGDTGPKGDPLAQGPWVSVAPAPGIEYSTLQYRVIGANKIEFKGSLTLSNVAPAVGLELFSAPDLPMPASPLSQNFGAVIPLHILTWAEGIGGLGRFAGVCVVALSEGKATIAHLPESLILDGGEYTELGFSALSYII